MARQPVTPPAGSARVPAPVTPLSQPPVASPAVTQRPVDDGPAPAASLAPAAPAVDRGALDEQRRRVIQMAQRIVTAKAALQSLRESMAEQGLRPRAQLQGSAQRVQFEMDQAEAALNSNNAVQGRQHLDYAERALEALEKALNL